MRLSLRWRVALWAAAATVLLGIAAMAAAYLVVRGSLRSDLERELREDAVRVAQVYAGSAGEATLGGPTGRVIVQLYGPQGRLLAASDPEFEAPEAAIPPDEVVIGDSWRGRLTGQSMQAAFASFELGTVAVLADTAFIGRSVAAVARALAVAALALALLAVPIGLLVARGATEPIRRLAGDAAGLGPERLDEIEVPPSRDEVARLAQVLNELVTRLRDARDAQRTFLAESSHELRTPLTSLQGFLRRARRQADPDTRRDLDDAARIAASMERLVEDLLELSRGQLIRELQPHLVDVHEDVVRPVAEEYPGVEARGAPGATVLGEPERLRQLLRNLVANAARASGDAARVRVVCRSGDGDVRVEVRDEGPGIPPEMLGRVFEKFTKGPGGGSGLGLPIARQLAELHGGTLTVRSRPGETVFTLLLPALEEEVEADPEAEADAGTAPEGGPRAGTSTDRRA